MCCHLLHLLPCSSWLCCAGLCPSRSHHILHGQLYTGLLLTNQQRCVAAEVACYQSIQTPLQKQSVLAENHAKFIDKPPQPQIEEQQKYSLVSFLDNVFGIPSTELALHYIMISQVDRETVTIRRGQYRPDLFDLHIRFRQPVQLTKAALLRHIAAAQPWDLTTAGVHLGMSQVRIPPVLASTTEHAMQSTDTEAIMFLRCSKLDCVIGSAIVNRRKIYYAVCSDWICALLGWTSSF